MKRFYLGIIFLGVTTLIGNAQDPHYSQFQAAPLVVNPAYTGMFEGQWRFMSNYRSQYGNLVAPFVTTTIAMDTKIGGAEGSGENPFNVGMQFMNDRTMLGIFSSNYITGTASYQVKLDKDRNKTLGLGLAGTYGSRHIDFNSVDFDAQFTSGGFDRSLPTGETVLQNMKSFISVGAGLLFAAEGKEGRSYLELGVSGYNLNEPKQTVLQDDRQFIPRRYAALITYKKMLNDDALIAFRALYQQQSTVKYTIVNVSAARLLSMEGTDMVGLGAWYRTGEGISPYVFLEYSNMQIGFSYDIATNRFRVGANPARSFEMSFQLRLTHHVDRMKCIRL